MAKSGVTCVLNVQTEIDHTHRGINWERMLAHYKAHGITAIHYPIHDFNEVDLKEKLYNGAMLLNKMLNEQNMNVYVHCTAGMGRAPAVVLVHLCLNEGMAPEDADLYVKSYRSVSVPNMRAVREIVEKHKK